MHRYGCTLIRLRRTLETIVTTSTRELVGVETCRRQYLIIAKRIRFTQSALCDLALLLRSPTPWRRDSNQAASGKPGAVQSDSA